MNTLFTFYCLTKADGGYILRPYINLYNNMIEIIKY
jgi:hypothetical protein